MLRSVLTGALRFRLVLVGIAAGVLILGVISLRQMHNDVLPELGSGPVLEVQTEALGLSSQEVEQYVTVPLENNLLDGVMGVWDVRSDSIPGLSSVDLYFEPGTTVLHARQLVEERLTNAFSLPNVSKPPLLIQPLSSAGRVIMIGLKSESLSPLELSYLARWIVKPRLSGVSGVANVAIFGQQDRQLQVLVDPARLAADQITLGQIISTAGNAQLVSPLTYLEGSSPGTGGFLDGPNQRLEIRPVLPLGAPANLASVPVSGASGSPRLGGVAKVVLGSQPPIGDALVGNGPGLVLVVQKLPSASVLGVTKGVDRALDELRPALAGVTVDRSLFRPAGYVSSALHNLALASIVAAILGLLAIAALFLQARAAFVGLLSVTLSFVAAALLLDALGYTINELVILGLVVSLSVVVDDAVSGTHEIVARIRARDEASDHEPLQVLVVDACAHLRSTLGYATLTVLLCAAPVFFSKGLTATFVHPMLLAFVLAVIASMAIALTITPALGMLLFDRRRPRRRERRLVRRIISGYEKVVQRSLEIPRAALAGVCLVGLVGIGAIPFLRQPAPPTFKDRNLVIQWDGAAGTSLAEMNRITQRVDSELQSLPAVDDVGATLGRAVSADQIVDPSSGQIFVTLRPKADYARAVAAVQAIVYGTPGMQAHLSTYESDVMSGVLAPADHQAVVRVYGEDYGELNLLAGQVSAMMSQIGGLGAPHVQQLAQEPNVEVSVNSAAALRAGVLPGDARREASTLVSGLTVGNFFQDQAVFDVVVRGAPSLQNSVGSVRNMLIDTASGGHVRLGDIAQVTVKADPVDIQHEAISRYVDVTAPVYGRSVSAAQADIQSRLSSISYPLGYHAEAVGGTPDDPTSPAAFLAYVLAAAVGIVLLLQAAFDSWRLAALLFLALPVALAGGLAVALASGDASSLGAYAGLLAVFALATRHGMLLIARIRTLQARDGGSLSAQIVVQAAADRFAPAIGATVVIGATLVPFVAIGDLAGHELTHVAAAVMLGGLASSMLLNVFVLPSVCLALGPTGPIPVAESEAATALPEPSPSQSS